MKTIELRRHATKIGSGNTDLSEPGIELAQRVGSLELRGKAYTHLFVSTLKRTQATMELFRTAADDFPAVEATIFPLHLEVAESPEAMSLWTGVCHAAEQAGEDMFRAALQDDHQIAQRVAKHAAMSFRKWIATLPEGAHALVVGHSPFLELIAYGVFGVTQPQLQPCEGYVIIDHSDSHPSTAQSLEFVHLT